MWWWIASVALAQEVQLNPLQQPPIALQVRGRQYCLDSGLQILLQVDGGHPSVSFSSVIDAGSRHDPVGQEGVAHVLEHLWFRSGQDEEARWQAARLGAVDDAWTSHDEVVFETTAPSSALRELIAMEARRLVDPLQGVDATVFDVEREVVRSELRLRFEHSASSGIGPVLSALYPEAHPYHRLPIGDHASLDGLTLEQTAAYAREYFTPERTTWIISGDIDIAKFERWLSLELPAELVNGSKRDQACAPRQTRPTLPPPDAVDPDAFLTVQANVVTPTAFAAWSLPPVSQTGLQIYGLVGAVEDALAHNDSTASVPWALRPAGVSCSIDDGVESATLMCELLLTDARHAEEVVRRALDGLVDVQALREVPSSHRDWRRPVLVDTLMMYEHAARGLDGSTARALYTHRTGQMDFFDQRMKGVLNAEDAAALALVQRWLQRRRAVTGVMVRSTDAAQDSEHATAAAAELRVADAPQGPADPVVPDLTGLVERRLDNGLTVWLLPYGEGQLVHAWLVFPGGDAHEPAPAVAREASGAVSTLGGALYTQPFTSLPFFMGGQWRTWIGHPAWSYGITVPAGSAEAGLDLLHKRVDRLEIAMPDRAPRVDALEVSLGWSWPLPSYQANRLLTDHLWGPDRHLDKDERTIDELQRVSKSDVVSYVRTMIHPGNATLILAGAIGDVDATFAAVERRFGRWKAKDAEPLLPARPLPPPPERRVVVVDDPHATVAYVDVQCALGSSDSAAYIAQDAVGRRVRDDAWVQLRERSGAAYDVSYDVTPLAEGRSHLAFTTEVAAGNAGASVALLLGELDALAAAPLADDQVDSLRRTASLEELHDNRTSEEVADNLAYAAAQQWGPGWLTQRADDLAALSADAIHREARACAGHEIAVVRGPAQPVLASLEAAGVPAEAWVTPPPPPAAVRGTRELKR